MFSWSNVYSYDKLFRMHIAKHPLHNWGIILQQAWSFCLTDKISQTTGNGFEINFNRRVMTTVKGKLKSALISMQVIAHMVLSVNLNIVVESAASSGMEHLIAGRLDWTTGVKESFSR